MDKTLPFVSVIIPVLNGERTLRDCLNSLLKMDYPEERREILVVDNGSTDSTAEIIKNLPVRYVQERRRGIPYARNKGIEESRGEIIAYTDSDCVVSKRWLSELVQGFEDGKIGAIEGETVDYPPSTPIERYMARRRIKSKKFRLKSPLYPYINTVNVAFLRGVFDRIGVFDTRFKGGSDVDLSWRFFQESKFELGYNPRAIVFHHHRNTVSGFFHQHVRMGRGMAVLSKKYPGRLPWSLGKELRAWRAVGNFAWSACRESIRYQLLDGKKTDVYNLYFTFLRKFAVRLGFVWESLTWNLK
jgi:glycosyltransferase involved in cell wall biosynthesis